MASKRWIYAVVLACYPFVAVADDALDKLKAKLESRYADLHIREIRPTPVAGLYELVFGTQVAYVTSDGRFMFTGSMVDMEKQKNLSRERRAGLIRERIEAIGESEMIIFPSPKKRHTVTVFTDVDCPYCARFHLEVPALNAAGISVRYLLFPRAGRNSESYRRAVSIWCAKDRNKAIGIAKSGGAIDMKDCQNPVDRHMTAGEDVGVTGTPTLVLDSGHILPGFVPAAELVRLIEQQDGAAATSAK